MSEHGTEPPGGSGGPAVPAGPDPPGQGPVVPEPDAAPVTSMPKMTEHPEPDGVNCITRK